MHDAYLIPFFIFGTLGFTLLVLALVFMFVKQKKRQYNYQNEKKAREYQYKNELLNTRLEVQEHLLNQVSREIHDNVGQVLSLVKLHLFSVRNQLVNDNAIRLIETSSSLLDKAIEDLRNISHAQNADLLERIGLQEAIRKELDYARSLKNMICDLEILGDYYSLPADKELLTYRILQEAIHNSMKHARCSKLIVSLTYEPGNFTLSVADNGLGFNVSDGFAAQGIGISHMQYRARMLNGSLDIQSLRLQGTSITLKYPLHNE